MRHGGLSREKTERCMMGNGFGKLLDFREGVRTRGEILEQCLGVVLELHSVLDDEVLDQIHDLCKVGMSLLHHFISL